LKADNPRKAFHELIPIVIYIEAGIYDQNGENVRSIAVPIGRNPTEEVENKGDPDKRPKAYNIT
jgi:hypothetical protein